MVSSVLERITNVQEPLQPSEFQSYFGKRPVPEADLVNFAPAEFRTSFGKKQLPDRAEIELNKELNKDPLATLLEKHIGEGLNLGLGGKAKSDGLNIADGASQMQPSVGGPSSSVIRK